MASIAYILMVTSAFLQSSNATQYQSSTAGREFFFGVLPFASGCCKDSRHKIPLDITNVSPNDTRIRVQIPYFNNDTYFDLPAGTTKRINLSYNIQRDGTYVEARGVKVTSNYDVTVLVSNVYNFYNLIDTYNVLPVTVIGNDYTISSYGSLTGARYGGVVSIAGVSNHTNVTIVNSTHLLRSEVINMFDIFQYLCDQCDLTGVRVISDKNVFIVAGSTYTSIPLSMSSEDYIASEMLPVSLLALNYIVPPVLPKSAFMLRILSGKSFSVQVSNITRSFTTTPSISELYFSTEAVVVTATSPFSLTQYGVSYDYDKVHGDPFMVATPGVNQYISNYKFNVPYGYYGNMIYYVAVIIPKLHKDGLVLDGTSLRTYNTKTSIKSLRVPAPFDNYIIMTFSISEGFHHFFHTDEVKFGLLVYGHGYSGDRALSYAFYAGYDLEDIPALDSRGPICFDCEHVSSPEECTKVTPCDSHQTCRIEEYKWFDQSHFKLGCGHGLCNPTKRTLAQDFKRATPVCRHCCSEDYCNRNCTADPSGQSGSVIVG